MYSVRRTVYAVQCNNNALFLQVYRFVAGWLTNAENHRTQRDHDNHLTFKIYLFEFVNYYGTLFYIAFFKGKLVDILLCYCQ